MSLLLMTGTIRPNANSKNLARTAVADRIEDYKQGLEFNIELLRRGDISSLVFVENSGEGMDAFSATVADSGISDRIELISYDAQQSQKEGRFVGECKLICEALSRSSLIKSCGESHVWKVTGRYTVKNLASILKHSSSDKDLLLHCRNYPMRYVDFGLAGFRLSTARDILNRILQRVKTLRDDERVLREMIDDGSFDDLSVSQRLPRVPNFYGVRGLDNSSYGGLRYRTLFAARSILNLTMPRIWI